MMSSSVRKIDDKLERLQPGSLRYQVLTSLRQFRASWVELGRLLNEVVYGGDYKEWGYDDFDVYCARELGLKKPTVQKLMISYNYMKKYECDRLKDFEESEGTFAPGIPDFQTVELLDKVRRKESLPEDEMTELHRRAFSAKEEADGIDLRKEIRQRLRSPIDEKSMRSASDARKLELDALLRLARELRRRLAMTKAVPRGLKGKLEQCLTELETLD